jgi:hypothetical protein
MKKLVLSLIVLAIGALGFFILEQLREPTTTGSVTIVLVDQDDNVLYEEEVSFSESDTLYGILIDTFDVSCADRLYRPTTCPATSNVSTVILGIETITTDWTTNYIAFYINDQYSNQGIDVIPLVDGNVYRFEETLVSEVSP